MSRRLLDRFCQVVTVSHVATPANARNAITARTGAGIRMTAAVSRSRIPAGYRPWSVAPVVLEPGHGEDRDRVEAARQPRELGPEPRLAAPLQLLEPAGQARGLRGSDGADVRALAVLGPPVVLDRPVGDDHVEPADATVARRSRAAEREPVVEGRRNARADPGPIEGEGHALHVLERVHRRSP